MGRDLGRDRKASPLGFSDEFDRSLGAEMGEVNAPARPSGQGDVPGDDHVLGRGRNAGQVQPPGDRPVVDHSVSEESPVLAVVDDQSAPSPGRFQHPAHEILVLDAPAVVGEGRRSGLEEGVEVDRLHALLAAGQGGDGKDADVGLGRRFADPSGHLGGIIDRGGVGHGADGRESAAGGGPGARDDRLLVGLARLPKMDVHVDETGGDDQAGSVDHLGAGGFDPSAGRDDFPAVQKKIADGVGSGVRVDQPSVPDQALGVARDNLRGRDPQRLRRRATGSVIKTSSRSSISFMSTRTTSRREVGRTFPT